MPTASTWQHRFQLGLACLLATGGHATASQSVIDSKDDLRLNILFLLADDQRADSIAALGATSLATPHLDELVQRGTVLTKATCSYPICIVSRAEIFTGRHCWENGVDGLHSTPNPNHVFWPKAFQNAGYNTAYIGKWHTSGRPSQHGITQVAALFSGGGNAWWQKSQVDALGIPITGYKGWVFQNDSGKMKFPELGVGLNPDISRTFADAAIGLIKDFKGKNAPWFLQVSFTAPHDPLFFPPGSAAKWKNREVALPGNFLPQHPFDHGNLHGRDEELLPFPRTLDAVKATLRAYDAVIEDLDNQVGRILAALETSGQRGRTLIIYSSDHGLAIGSHGLRGKQNQYEHTINVPLILAGPGIPQGRRCPAQVYLRELYPTTCELAAIPIPVTVTASSFAPLLLSGNDSHHEDIFGCFTDTQRMIRSKDGWKYIRYPKADRKQLFNLAADPLELHDLSEDPAQAQRLGMLAEKLNAWRQEAGDPAPLP